MTAMTVRRDYLAGQRRTIIARSLLGSLAGAVPIPFVDDWAVSAIVGSGYRKIAAAHHVDIDDDAINKLVFGKSTPTSIASIAAAGVVTRIAGRAARRMMIVIATVNRARAASRNFVAMTLFDHYCAKLHTGLSLDAETALALREEIGRAIEHTPGALAFHPFRRAALAAARATVRAPLELADLASGGRLRKMLASKTRDDVAEPKTVDEVEQALDAALAQKKNFLARTVTSVEVQLSAEANPFLDAAIESLDRRWRARVAAKTTS
jgi:uncharacterized protein (DUF697 family)